MPHCQNCGNELQANQAFCIRCGAPAYSQPGPAPYPPPPPPQYAPYAPPPPSRRGSGCGKGCLIAGLIALVILVIVGLFTYNYIKNYDWGSLLQPSCEMAAVP